jgi:sugar-specific transcriptional regulator TrmB
MSALDNDRQQRFIDKQEHNRVASGQMDADKLDKLVLDMEKLGLGKTEATLYIAGLSYIQAVGVPELQKRTGFKRPTIYHNLQLLETKGLVAKASTHPRTLFSFSPPDQLERMVESEVRQAKAKLHVLAALQKTLEAVQPEGGQTIVRHYEGVQGIKTAVDMALYCRNPYWQIIAPVQNIFTEFDSQFARYYLLTRKRHGIKSKTLWEAKIPDGRKLTEQEITDRQPRYLPSNMTGQFSSTVIMFDNKIALISSMKEQSAILIESDEFTQLFGALFEGLWNISEPYNLSG